MLITIKNLTIKTVFKFLLILSNLLLVILVVTFYPFEEVPHEPKEIVPVVNKARLSDFECHYDKERDALPPVDKTVTFPPNSIFFIHSSCSELTSRQACSVESAARANPDRQVNVLFTSPVTWDTFKGSAVATLLSITNVEAGRIHLETYAEGTPLHSKMMKTPLTREDLNMDIADILKYLTLYKYSGIYLATDVIVARSFSNLTPNWIVKETPGSMSSDMFSFSENTIGRTLSDIALNLLQSELAVSEKHAFHSFHSSTIIKRIMHLWCGIADIRYMTAETCQDLGVGKPEYFFPISFLERRTYFMPGDWDEWKNRKIYTYRIWDRFTKHKTVMKNSLYDKIAKEYCPVVYNHYGDKFGT